VLSRFTLNQDNVGALAKPDANVKRCRTATQIARIC